VCDGHKCGCARARTRLLCARAHVWDTGVGARASTGCARAGTSERVGVGGWGCGWGARGCVGGRVGVCVARECEGVRARGSACVRVCVCVCAGGRVCAGGCVGVCPCSEALFLEDRKISEKKSSLLSPSSLPPLSLLSPSFLPPLSTAVVPWPGPC